VVKMMHSLSRTLALIIIAGCTACATVPAPTDADIRLAYKPASGPLTLKTEYRLELNFPELEKDLTMRVVFPEEPGPYPLIVFSHGNGCLQDLYTGFADHWASWGYVVIQPVHMDSRELGFSMKRATAAIMNKVISSRISDVRFILDSLDQIEAQVPGLASKIDRERLVIAGHSMGAGTAMNLTGVTMVSPVDGTVVGSDEDRFDAVILISEPGNNRIMPEHPWRFENVPTFIATGSEDFSSTGARDGVKSRSAYQLVDEGSEPPEQPHYYLYMQDSDHYLGGVICKADAPGPPDYEALKIINGTSIAFLDAFIGDDAAAHAFLDSGDITEITSDRATLELR
jgi:pimeloyl-ACP methyl ester carboxylesterase